MLRGQIRKIRKELEEKDLCIWSLKAGGIPLCSMSGAGCQGRKNWENYPQFKELAVGHTREMWLRVVAQASLSAKK